MSRFESHLDMCTPLFDSTVYFLITLPVILAHNQIYVRKPNTEEPVKTKPLPDPTGCSVFKVVHFLRNRTEQSRIYFINLYNIYIYYTKCDSRKREDSELLGKEGKYSTCIIMWSKKEYDTLSCRSVCTWLSKTVIIFK